MKLHAAGRGAYNTITGYGDDYVIVNSDRHQSSLIVTPEQVVSWPTPSFDDLTEQSFELVKKAQPDIVLLGTGPRQRFPHPRLTNALSAARIGVEVMDLKAACRTYNILVAEGRKVAAALLLK